MLLSTNKSLFPHNQTGNAVKSRPPSAWPSVSGLQSETLSCQ